MFVFRQITSFIILIIAYFTLIPFANAQPNLISGLSLWLKSDTGVVYDINNKVSDWNDISGNGISLTQTNNSLQPLYIMSVDSINYKPTIRFNGNTISTNQHLTIGSIFILANYDSDNFLNYSGLFTRIAVEDGNTDYLLVSSAGGTSFYSSILGSNLYINDIQTYNFSPLKRPKIIYGFLNTPATWNDFALGLDRSLGGRYWKGDIFEIIVFDRVLQANEVAQVKTYLMNNYAPPVSLPNDTILTSFCPFTIKTQGYYTSYQWSNGSTNDSLVVQQSGNYKVTATDIFGRQSIDSIFVQYPMQAFQSNYLLCSQDSITLETGLSNSDYSFVWQNGDTNSSFVIHLPGQFFVHITDSLGCSYFSDTINVQYDTFSLESVLNDSISICTGDTLNANNLAATSYLWSTNETTSYILPQTTQWYFITLTNSNHCKLIDSCFVTIKGTKPQPSIQKNNLCTNSSTIYIGNSTGNIQQWEWTFQDSITQYGQQTNFLYQEAGIYQTILHVIDVNTCESSVISIDTIYYPPRAAFNYNVGCSGQNTILISTSISQDSIIEYNWNINNQLFQNSFLNINLNPSEYYIKHWLTTKHGCNDSVIQKIFIENNPPTLPADLNFPNNGININSNSIRFSWNNHLQTSSIEVSYLNDFSNVAFRSPKTTNNFYTFSSFLSDTTLYWRVWTYNACNDSTSSPIYYFKNYNCGSVDSLSLWLKSDSGIVKDINNNVSEWHDISGNNLNFSQIDDNLKPLFITSIDSFNHKPSVRLFNSQLILNQNIKIGTFYILANYHNDAFTDNAGLLTRINVNDGNTDFLIISNNTGTSLYNSFISQNIFINNIQSLNFAPLKRLKLIKGMADPVLNWDDLAIGYDRSYGSRFWNGDITEAVIFKNNLNPIESNLIEQYLMDKYAPPVLLPADTILTSFCPFAIVPKGYFTSYQWNTGETNDTLMVLQSGKYIVTATDIFGRISKDSIVVTFPSTNIPDTVFVCLGDSVLITSSLCNLVDYQWSNGGFKNYTHVKDEGWYYITLTDMQSCSNIDSFFVKVDSISTWTMFSSDSLGLCNGNILTVESTPFNITSYVWTPTNDHTSSTIVNQSGWYSVEVQDINQCRQKDSVFVTIMGLAPIANFSFSHTCKGQETFFTDQSVSLDTSAISSWQWIVQNDTITTQHPVYQFSDYGNYYVKLIVGTSSGCYQTNEQSISIFPLPNPSFNAVRLCSEHETFFSSHTTIPYGNIMRLTWIWGDGTTSFDSDTAHVFSQPGSYLVTLIAESDQNCVDSISKNVEIKPSPIAGFDVSPSCNLNPTFFVDTSKTDYFNPIMQWTWLFGDGAISHSQHPNHVYQQTGIYNIELIIKSLNGCMDTTQQSIIVSSKPNADFNLDNACVGQPILLQDNSTITNGQITEWSWYVHNDFFSSLQNPTYIPSELNNLPFTLIVKSNSRCTDTISKSTTVYPKPFVNFDLNPTYGALPLTVQFINLSEFGSSNWNFGDGSFSSQANPIHVFQDSGLYRVWLTQTSIHGCIDSVSKTVLVVPNLLDLAIESVNYTKQASFIFIHTLISNVGTLPIENPVLSLIVDGQTFVSEIVYDTLFSGEKRYYTFNGIIPTASGMPNYLCVNGSILSTQQEVNLYNNENCLSFSEEEQILNLYPNPANDQLYMLLQLNEEQNVLFSIIDITGKTVYQDQRYLQNVLHKINIDITSLSQGMYALQVKTKKHTFVHKFIKE